MSEQVSFGQWLRQRRKELDLTREEFADRVGCSVDTVRKVEEGLRRPSKQLAELFAASLDVPLEEQQTFVHWARTISWAPVPHVEQPSALAHPNPYKGLRPFYEADAGDFFGRETLTQRLLDRLAQPAELSHFLAVVGPSGSGKSSVVRAGLIPALRRGRLPGMPRLVVVDMVPGSHPFEELEAGLLRVAANPPDNLLEQLQRDDRGLLRAGKRVLPGPGEPDTKLLLFIDQFEEVFTLVQDETVRGAFLTSVCTAMAQPGSPIWVVVTLRADFYDRPLLYDGCYQLMRDRTEVVGPMSLAELRRSITGPAERVGVTLEPELVETIEQDVIEQPGALPLMEYALTELFEHRDGPVLTLATYRSIGGVVGALGRRAEAIYGELSQVDKEETRQLFLRLVTLGEGTEDTRRRVRRAELASAARDEEALDRVLDIFGRYRLLTFDRDLITRGPTVEVAHEELLRSWGRLREWLDVSRAELRTERQLMAAAREWAGAGHDPSFLAAGARLAQFETLSLAEAEGNPTSVALTAEERAYIEACVAERDRQEAAERERQAHEVEVHRREAGRLRVFVGALGLLLVVAVGLAAFAFDRQAYANSQSVVIQDTANRAEAAAATAVANYNRAEAQRLAAEANTLLQVGGNSQVIALLSIRSMSIEYSPQGDAALEGAAALAYPDRLFAGHTEPIWDVEFLPDGKTMVTTSSDKTARLWDVATGKELRTFSGHTADVESAAFSPDGKTMVTCSVDKTARLWDVATGKELRVFSGHADQIWGAAYSPDGKYVLTGSVDKTARLWDANTGKEVRSFPHAGIAYGVAFSPDGKQVATADLGDNTARLWDVATGQPLRVFKGHTGGVLLVAFSLDGRYLVTSSLDQTARLWDVASGEELHQLLGHTSATKAVAFSPDGLYVLTTSDDGTARLWDAATGKEVRRLIGHTSAIYAGAYSRDGRYLVTAGGDRTALMWEAQPRTALPRFTGHTGPIGSQGVAVSPDGKYVLTGSGDHTARLWEAATGKELRQLTGHTAAVISVAFSPDGKWALTASDDKSARLWDVATGKELRRFNSQPQPVDFSSVAFSPDGKYALTGNFDQVARLWEAAMGTELRQLTGHTSVVGSVAFSPSGEYILTGSGDKTARLWDAATGKELHRLEGHTDSVVSVAFSPDGKYALTGSNDHTARLWDVATGAKVREFTGHADQIWTVAYSPDGKYVLTGSSDKTARLWDASTGTELRRFTGPTGTVLGLAFSPDGKAVIAGSGDRIVRMWYISYHHTARYLCKRLLRDLSDDEREEYDIRDKERTCSK
jgi:WD40 repeat protein/transcriptional regulator with XRE-family HTH domain